MLGNEPIIIEHFYGFEGVFVGLIMGSQNIMGSDYGSNISEDSIDEQSSRQGILCTEIIRGVADYTNKEDIYLQVII